MITGLCWSLQWHLVLAQPLMNSANWWILLESLGRTLTVFMSFQIKPISMSNSALGLLPIYSKSNSKTCYLHLGWGLLGECCLYFCFSVEQISWGMSAISPNTRKRCSLSWKLRKSYSETFFLICVTMSLIVSFRVQEKQNILLRNKYLRPFLKAGQ